MNQRTKYDGSDFRRMIFDERNKPEIDMEDKVELSISLPEENWYAYNENNE